MLYTECAVCGCHPKPDEWSSMVIGACIDCGQKEEIIRTNSTGLVIYNPKNLADRIKGMKNKNISREDKIAARLKYNQQQSQQ